MSHYRYISIDAINEMADGEKDFIADILNNCLETMGPNIHILQDAVRGNDTQSVLFQAHKLKGSFRFIGANEIASLMEQTENETKAAGITDKVKELTEDAAELYKIIEQEILHMAANL